jgi:predicted dehydrogenase
MTRLRVLVAGCGNMGTSHARAYHRLRDDFEIVGLVSRGPRTRERLAAELGGTKTFADFAEAYRATRPDVVSINTYPDTHAAIARTALAGGSHVFVEKPLAESVAEAREIALAQQHRRGSWSAHPCVHPAWQKFIEIAHARAARQRA